MVVWGSYADKGADAVATQLASLNAHGFGSNF